MTITTPTTSTAWSPDGYAFAPFDALPEAIILGASTVSGQIEGDEPSLRVATVADDTAAVYAEGAEIDFAQPELGEIIVNTSKVGQLHRVSREQWGQPNVSSVLSTSASRAIVTTANDLFVNADRDAASTGLLNVSGIVEGDEVADNLDSLIDLVAQLNANGAQPTVMLLAPTAWAELRKVKTASDSSVNLLGAGTTDAQAALLDIPVRVTPALTGTTGLVVDATSVVSAVGQVQVATSEHAHFASDSIALRTTWRFGWGVIHPNRIGSFTVATSAE